jgi:acyl carrier protein
MLTRAEVCDEFRQLLERRGGSPEFEMSTPLRDIEFRSLDFSELALRIEKRLGRELNFDAAMLRQIRTVHDVVEFFEISQ